MAPTEAGLPAQLWALALGYLYFDKVLAFAAVNRALRRDVPPAVRHLCVRAGEGMTVGPGVAERFCGATEAFLYVVAAPDGGAHRFHLNHGALRTAAPFLARLPRLAWAWIGAEHSECSFARESVRHGWPYDPLREGDYDLPNSKAKYAAMILSVCREFRVGNMLQVDIEGLLPVHSQGSVCAWKNLPKVSCYRTDVSCQICDVICMSFPPAKLITLTDMEVPCISLDNRLAIARFRDESTFQRTLTQALVTVLKLGRGRRTVLYPPDFDRPGVSLCYDEYVYDMVRCFVSHGANVEGPSLQNLFLAQNASEVDPQESGNEFLGPKRILTLKTYTSLINTGLHLNAENFIIVDESDERTEFIRPKVHRAREQWNVGTALSQIQEVREWVEQFVRFFHEEGEENILESILLILERKLDTDLSENTGQVASLVEEFDR